MMVEFTAQHLKSPLYVFSYDVTTAFAFLMRNKLDFVLFLLHFQSDRGSGFFAYDNIFPFSSGLARRKIPIRGSSGSGGVISVACEGACGYGHMDMGYFCIWMGFSGYTGRSFTAFISFFLNLSVAR